MFILSLETKGNNTICCHNFFMKTETSIRILVLKNTGAVKVIGKSEAVLFHGCDLV